MQTIEGERDARADAPSKGEEKREWPRIPAAELRDVKARLSTGGEVTLRDLSRAGARLESTRRMLPNSTISLTLTTPDARVVMSGVIVRSRIVRLPGGLGYDVAVSFDQLLQLPGMPTGAPQTAANDEPPAPPHAERVAGEPDELAVVMPDVALRVTAEADGIESLQGLLDGNGW